MNKPSIRVQCYPWVSSIDGKTFIMNHHSLINKLLLRNFEIIYDEVSPNFVFDFAYNTHRQITTDSPTKVNICCMGECVTPNFNFYDYAIGFDYLSFGNRYFRHPTMFFNYILGNKDCVNISDFPLVQEDEANKLLQDKKEFCTFVVSNNNHAHKNRVSFFNKLTQYKKVLSGGRALNNIGGPVSDKIRFQAQSKFAIAFENTSYIGYSTEKIIDAFLSKTIPIYWGDPRIAEYVNPESFVNCHDYGSLDEVVEKIKEIDQDDTLWKKMMMAYPKLDTQKINRDIQQLESFLVSICSQDPQKVKRTYYSYHNAYHNYLNTHCKYKDTIIKIRELQEAYHIPRSLIERLVHVLYIKPQFQYREELKTIEICIHAISLDNFMKTSVYRILLESYNIVLKEDAHIHIYVDYMEGIPPHGSYRDDVNIHITSRNTADNLTCLGVPDFNIYDYAVGYHEIDFGTRYLNLQKHNTKEHIKHFFDDIFESLQPFQRTKEFIVSYYVSQENIWISNTIYPINNLVWQKNKYSLLYISLKFITIAIRIKRLLMKILTKSH